MAQFFESSVFSATRILPPYPLQLPAPLPVSFSSTAGKWFGSKLQRGRINSLSLKTLLWCVWFYSLYNVTCFQRFSLSFIIFFSRTHSSSLSTTEHLPFFLPHLFSPSGQMWSRECPTPIGEERSSSPLHETAPATRSRTSAIHCSLVAHVQRCCTRTGLWVDSNPARITNDWFTRKEKIWGKKEEGKNFTRQPGTWYIKRIGRSYKLKNKLHVSHPSRSNSSTPVFCNSHPPRFFRWAKHQASFQNASSYYFSKKYDCPGKPASLLSCKLVNSHDRHHFVIFTMKLVDYSTPDFSWTFTKPLICPAV